MEVVTKRVLSRRKRFSDTADDTEPLSMTIKVRKPKKRKTGKLDFSDYSELTQRDDAISELNPECLLTEAVANDLQTYITRGLGLKEACTLTGVDYKIFLHWREVYPRFNQAVDSWIVTAESDALERIREAMKGGMWSASAWFLERLYPNKYGKRDVLKQEIYWKHIEFVKIVLEVVNETSPEIRTAIVGKLRARKIDIGD